jgi:hypothetical protein
MGSKCALAEIFEEIVKVSGFSFPAKSPDHPLNSYPIFGVADRVTVEFRGKEPIPDTLPCPRVRIETSPSPNTIRLVMKIDIKTMKYSLFNF